MPLKLPGLFLWNPRNAFEVYLSTCYVFWHNNGHTNLGVLVFMQLRTEWPSLYKTSIIGNNISQCAHTPPPFLAARARSFSFSNLRFSSMTMRLSATFDGITLVYCFTKMRFFSESGVNISTSA